jgi:hypothetical protein
MVAIRQRRLRQRAVPQQRLLRRRRRAMLLLRIRSYRGQQSESDKRGNR